MSASYQRLNQSVEEEEEEENDDVGDIEAPLFRSPNSTRPRRLRPGSIDLSKLDNAFKRWTESIAQKVKRKRKVVDHSRKQIWRSVFEPTVAPIPSTGGLLKTLDHKPPMTRTEFDNVTQSIKNCIAEGIHPKMITKGSSGSYFARAKVEGRVQTVAVFKPKDEEPYGRLNPKTTKWIHRQLRWIIPFGRACLIPNLSYISEAAASLLDDHLNLHVVPPTRLVSFSSPAFFYDWIDRNGAKKGKPLPEKIGSLQYFLHGYQDASEFLRKHPWPGRAIVDTFDDSNHRQTSHFRRFSNAFRVICGRTGDIEDVYDDYDDQRVIFDSVEAGAQAPFYWSQELQHSFREELEKLVILDYLMLNTDRGADNYMIKYCTAEHEKSLIDVAPSRMSRPEMPLMSELRKNDPFGRTHMEIPGPYAAGSSSGTSTPRNDYTRRPHIHIAAIDNSLSFPHEHPQGWRSYTYGWLYLPISIIGRPFSEKTRNHFLPLLTSKEWWENTTHELQKLFAVDPDFHPKMFSRQLAVIKGQAWNIVQSLRHADEGPLELTRRKKVLVWDDELEISDDNVQDDLASTAGPTPSSPRPSVSSVPLPPRRSRSEADDFPPPLHRTSTDATGVPRPVPFVAKFDRVHPGTTGVTVLEHLERLDAVEAGLQRLAGDQDRVPAEDMEEEVDVGESISRKPIPIPGGSKAKYPTASSPPVASSSVITRPFSPPGSPLETVREVQEVTSSASSVMEEDLVAMSKSTSHVEGRSPLFFRWSSAGGQNMEWLDTPNAVNKRTVIVERLEAVDKKPLCSGW